MKMKINVKRIEKDAKIPSYTITGDAGLELYAASDMLLKVEEIKSCGTGIAMAIPAGYVGLIWDKSGIAVKKGIKTMGGVIDSNFRGEIGVIMKNLSNKEYVIKKGDKIAQILIQKIENPEIEVVDSLDNTERGNGMFGSTGIR